MNTDTIEWARQRLEEIAQQRREQLAVHRVKLQSLDGTALPCPFCGTSPSIGPRRPDLDGSAWGFVRCENGQCAAQPEVRDGSKLSDERGSHAYIALAIRRWNRRA